MNKIVKKINTEVAKSMPGVSVQRGIIAKEKEEYIFRMIAGTPYGRVICNFVMSRDLMKDESVMASIFSDALIDEIRESIKKGR